MVIEKHGMKYACLPCIRGHRVKKCQHHDRQLAPLSKRGRQVSQCNHCRDLRSSGSHVKCTCASASVSNRLNGCLCEISQTCTCVARHLQNVQTTPLKTDNESVSLSTSTYSHRSLSPSLSTTSATATTAIIRNDPSITNHSSPPLMSSFDDSSLDWLPSNMPASSSIAPSQDNLLGYASFGPQNPISSSTTATDISISISSSPSSLLHQSHNTKHSPTNSSQALMSPSAGRDLINIFLHKDIDDLLLL